MFDDLMAMEGEDGPEGTKVHAPSRAPNAKYECLRCSIVRSGYKTIAVRFNQRIGLCEYCCSEEEIHAGFKLKAASAVRRALPKEEVQKLAESVEQVVSKRCPRCKKPAPTGLISSILKENKLICFDCREREMAEIARNMRKGGSDV